MHFASQKHWKNNPDVFTFFAIYRGLIIQILRPLLKVSYARSEKTLAQYRNNVGTLAECSNVVFPHWDHVSSLHIIHKYWSTLRFIMGRAEVIFIYRFMQVLVQCCTRRCYHDWVIDQCLGQCEITIFCEHIVFEVLYVVFQPLVSLNNQDARCL